MEQETLRGGVTVLLAFAFAAGVLRLQGRQKKEQRQEVKERGRAARRRGEGRGWGGKDSEEKGREMGEKKRRGEGW